MLVIFLFDIALCTTMSLSGWLSLCSQIQSNLAFGTVSQLN